MTTKIPVDEYCQKAGQVYEDYDCVLNQTCLRTNKNKFYIMQIIKTSKTSFNLYIRYGRIGEIGKISYQQSSDPDFLVSKFKGQFRQKTKNQWDDRFNFKKQPEKYYLTQRAISASTTDNKSSNNIEEEPPQSTLDPKIIDFLDLIGNITMLQKTLKHLNIDSEKMPLGAISTQQLDHAEQVLRQIRQTITQAQSQSPPQDQIIDMSSEYYTYVPTSVGRRTHRPPPLSTLEQIDQHLEKIEDLRNLKIAYNTISNSLPKNEKGETIHPADHLHSQLNTELEVLPTNDPAHQLIHDYVTNTQGKTHHCNIQLVEIYRLKGDPAIPPETKSKLNLDLIGNRHLLFHGTRISNMISILKTGLVLRPEILNQGVFISGKMFGYGIYAANSFSKSFNYCDCPPGEECCLFLAEVSLGKILPLNEPDYYLNTQELKTRGGYHSVQGTGKWTPKKLPISDSTPKGYPIHNGTTFPNQPLTRSDIKSPYLLYDEFVVYRKSQIKLKYIIRVKNLG